MAFDGIITKSIISELQPSIIEGKINKIFEPNKNNLILCIYNNGINYALNICIDSTNCRFHLTTLSKPNPLVAPNFCMLLRKHITGYRIKSISSYNLERVITIELEGRNELNDSTTKKLIIELMGKHSNIILLNDKNYIIDTLRHIDSLNTTRDLLPAHEYEFPENNKKDFLEIHSYNDFLESIQINKNMGTLDKIISTTFTGFSMSLVQSLLADLNIDNNDLSNISTEKIYNSITNIITNIDSNKISCKTFVNEKSKTDYVISFVEKSENLSINFFIDDFYNSKELSENLKNYRNTLLKIILDVLSKYKNRLVNINNKIIECENRDIYRLYGELITTNLYKIKNENISEIILENYYDNNNPIKIPLDKTISPSNNAKKYFKKYNKLKNALEISSTQKKETLDELNYLESIIYELDSCDSLKDINYIYTELSESAMFKEKLVKTTNSKKKEKANTEFSPTKLLIDNYTVLVGKNNKENDYLTTKLAHNNDIWFHTKDIHGSHVILKTNGDEINQNTLIKCAQIAALHSKAKLSSNVPVDYCYIKYVKKPNGSKPGMVIYTNNKTLYVEP